MTPRTLHIVTVGTSILGHLEAAGGDADTAWSSGLKQLFKERRDIVRAAVEPRDILVAKALDWLRGDRSDEVPQPIAHIDTVLDDERWGSRRVSEYARVSAEVNGFMAHVSDGSPAKLRVPDGDFVVILASDTAKGKTAAMWVAGMMSGEDRWSSVTSGIDDFASGQRNILVSSVPQLSAATLRRFPEQLGKVLVRIYDAVVEFGSAAEVKFHLSGGYKAALPYYLAAGEWMTVRHAGERPGPRVSAYALHEDMTEVMALPTHRIYVKREEREFILALADGNHAGLLNEYTLNGRAYIADREGKRQLTPYGEGLISFLRHAGHDDLR